MPDPDLEGGGIVRVDRRPDAHGAEIENDPNKATRLWLVVSEQRRNQLGSFLACSETTAKQRLDRRFLADNGEIPGTDSDDGPARSHIDCQQPWTIWSKRQHRPLRGRVSPTTFRDVSRLLRELWSPDEDMGLPPMLSAA